VATDGPRAHDILLGYEPLANYGWCWNYVWNAYAAAGASTSMGSTPTAYKGWEVTWGKHPGDRNVPNGGAIWLGRRYDGNMDGDVFIGGSSDGQHAATDQPIYGQTGVVSIQARMDLCGREYLGWTDHVCDCPINTTGGTPPAGNQRQTTNAPANQRPEPTTASPATQQIAANTIGTFDGWIHGENVQGQDIWFRGAYSQLWSWAGGFTDQGTHDLADLNPVIPTDPKQRVVLSTASANGRSDPSTANPVTQVLAAGSVATMDGWITGEVVEGNGTWFRGGISGDFFWSGGFTDTGTHDLEDLNNPDPPPTADGNRTTVDKDANVRNEPKTTATVIGSIPPNTTVLFDGFAHGENVEGNDVWFRQPGGEKWSWSGGFTSESTDGLTEVTPVPPNPGSGDNPRGLATYTPVYPRAVIGLVAPLGFVDCANPVERSPRTEKGARPNQVPTSGIIDRFIIHWTGVTGDQTDYFSYCNDRSSCPTIYIDADARPKEMIRPGAKPAATGSEWNWRSWAVETQMLSDPVKPISDAQLEELAQEVAFLASFDGGTLDGAPVDFQIDREHVIGHRDAVSTECPGDYLYGKIDDIIARALEIAGGETPPPSTGWPLDPGEYPTLYALHGELNDAFGPIGRGPTRHRRGRRWLDEPPPLWMWLVASLLLGVAVVTSELVR
jgi:hypothetical protein